MTLFTTQNVKDLVEVVIGSGVVGSCVEVLFSLERSLLVLSDFNDANASCLARANTLRRSTIGV